MQTDGNGKQIENYVVRCMDGVEKWRSEPIMRIQPLYVEKEIEFYRQGEPIKKSRIGIDVKMKLREAGRGAQTKVGADP